MRRTQYPNTGGGPPYARLILPVCALIVLPGCPQSGYTPFSGHPSPITVADGSMLVRTNTLPMPTFDGSTLTISGSGGQACAIIANGTLKSVKGLNWTITSSDNNGTVSTTDGGKTIIAKSTVAGAASLSDDKIDGPGASFAVQFSPARLLLNGVTSSLDCGKKDCYRCRIKIDYEPSCP
jgi:hypothetical protein